MGEKIMSEQTLVNEEVQDIKDDPLMGHTKAELIAMLREKETKSETEKGFIITTPDRGTDDDGNPLPGYTGMTNGIFFRNGIAFVSLEELAKVPPVSKDPKNQMDPEAKITWICRDFGYKWEPGTAGEAMARMGGMQAMSADIKMIPRR
jgi:hypothetical protein